MLKAEFFQRFGIFVFQKFLDVELCRTIALEMSLANSVISAEITKDGIDRVDETIRRTKCVKVSENTKHLIYNRIASLKQRFEEHFSMKLGHCENPQFLAYRQGDFFKAHTDNSAFPQDHLYMQRRKLSVVIFINGDSSGSNTYTGGSLVFYGLIQQPVWENCGFHLKPEPGVLIAFPADILHEVAPIVQGNRYSIVSWFPSSMDAPNSVNNSQATQNV